MWRRFVDWVLVALKRKPPPSSDAMMAYVQAKAFGALDSEAWTLAAIAAGCDETDAVLRVRVVIGRSAYDNAPKGKKWQAFAQAVRS